MTDYRSNFRCIMSPSV